ncbi:hypothetical protein DL771_010644 [Monosporascus sp. 5C6A]|nr:hypothetical protein DL771_010644 [Monosporascus sp. 5C6A]
MVTDAGFPIARAQPKVKGISVAHDLEWSFPEFFGSIEIAKKFIEGQLAALRELKPDIVFHGMRAPASPAARNARDPHHQLPTRPVTSGKWLAWLTGGMTVKKAPIFHQHNLGAAAAACGWPVKDAISLFDMNMVDLNLVNDHPAFHADYAHRLPKNIVITGPVFAPKDFLFDAIKALRLHKEDDWKAVVLPSPSICAIEKVQEVADRDPRLLVAQRFIPALAANALVDVAAIHGGQGTVQTALAAGKPTVGVALQIEQQTNLGNVMDAGAGIRIQRQHWKAKNIRNAVRTVLDNPSCMAKAEGHDE